MKHLEASSEFKRKHRKLIKNNKLLKDRINSTLIKLEENPFDFSLRTHSVNISKFGKVNSSSVTGDIRIVWVFDKNNNVVILLLDIGGHSGGKGVYK